MPNSLNPFALLARRWQPSAAFVRRTALATVVLAVVIVATGAAVRLTGSGLGCSTWPRCTPDSLTPTKEMGIHGLIEFGNRMLTYVLSGAVGLAILAARARTPWRHDLTRLGWVQFWVVMSNAVVGGITVKTGLNPYSVAAHFLITTALLTVAVVMWQRTQESDAPARALVPLPVSRLTQLTVAATGALIVVGTTVTGAGPHAGDAREVYRIPVDWERITQLHVDLVFLVLHVVIVFVFLSVALFFVLRAVDAPGAARARGRDLLVVLLGQGLIGFVQYFTGVPEILVGLHMVGSCLVWIAVLRVLLSLRERPYEPGSAEAAGIPARDGSAVPAGV